MRQRVPIWKEFAFGCAKGEFRKRGVVSVRCRLVHFA
jgi:hypothetical protein